MNEFNSTFEVQKMGNEAFQTPRFQTGTRVTVASGPNGVPSHFHIYRRACNSKHRGLFLNLDTELLAADLRGLGHSSS